MDEELSRRLGDIMRVDHLIMQSIHEESAGVQHQAMYGHGMEISHMVECGR